MFTPEEREALRSALVARAGEDARITGIAITGSAAKGQQDRWSDVDLAFGLRDANDQPALLAEWSGWMRERYQAVHSLDLSTGPWTYRVFLLPNTLQVDLAFVAEAHFRALTPHFRLVRGIAQEAVEMPAPPADFLIGMGWLYALHARSAIARAKPWQAEQMVSGLRHQTLALLCLRHGHTTAHGKGIDLLPEADLAPFPGTLIRNLSPAELHRAFLASLDAYQQVLRDTDPRLAAQLQPALQILAASLPPPEARTPPPETPTA